MSSTPLPLVRRARALVAPGSRGRFASLVLIVGVLAASVAVTSDASSPSVTGSARASAPADARRAFAKLPLRFEPNQGQTDPQVRFTARAGASQLFLTRGEAVLSSAGDGERAEVVRMQFLGADDNAAIAPAGLQPTRTNYLIGQRDHWATGVPSYSKVSYRSLYPGIDAVFHGDNGPMEYDFEVAPGADPAAIRLGFADRAATVDTDGALMLASPTGGTHRQEQPTLYQVVDGNRVRVDGGFAVRPDGSVGFDVGTYDHTRTLVIDPILGYSTVLGGSDEDAVYGVAVDSSGSAYITGTTRSGDFPLTAAYQPTYGDSGDIFVTKLDPAGSSAVFSTYLGGNGEDTAQGIALDATGVYLTGHSTSAVFPTTPGSYLPNRSFTDGASTVDATTYTSATAAFGAADVGRIIVGDNIADGTTIAAVVDASTITLSSPATFTGTGLSFTVAGRPSGTAVVTKLDLSGASLAYSTYLGGTQDSGGSAIAVDPSGNAFVHGFAGADFPTTAGAFSANRSFADGATTVDSTTFTSATANFSAADVGRSVSGANIADATTVASLNSSTSVELSNPATATSTGLAFTLGGHTGSETFVAKLNASGGLAYSTYTGPASPGSITVSGGIPVVAQTTTSSAFPVTAGAFDTSCGTDGTCNSGQPDATVTKLDPAVVGDGSGVVSGANAGLVYSTFLGGQSADEGHAVAADSSGAVYVGGQTRSPGFPATAGSFGPACGEGTCNGGQGYGFVTKVMPDGASLGYSGFLGPAAASGWTWVRAIAVDAGGAAYAAGFTEDSGFPLVDPLLPSSGSGDAFVASVAAGGGSLAYSTYFGGGGADDANAIALDATGAAYVGGRRESVDLPATTTLGPTTDSAAGFVAKFAPGASPPLVTGLSPSTGQAIPTVITGSKFTGATGVQFGSVPATSFSVDSDTQITAVAPFQPIGTTAAVTVTGPTGTSLAGTRATFRYTEGAYTLTGSCATICAFRSTLLEDGRVLTLRAQGGPLQNGFYNPLSGTWTARPNCTTCAQQNGTGSPLITLHGSVAQCGTNCGKAFWSGGTGASTTVSLWNPADGSWSTTTAMPIGRNNQGVIQLPSGRVLEAGGCDVSGSCFGGSNGPAPAASASLFDPAASSWASTGSMATGRSNFPTVYVDPAAGPCGTYCGKVLVFGGAGGSQGKTPLSSVEAYDPATGTWAAAPSLSLARRSASAHQLQNGKILVYGASFSDSAVNSTSELFDPSAGTWSPVIPMNAPSREVRVGAVLPNGKVLTTVDGVTQLFDPATNAWGLPGEPIFPHGAGTATLLAPGPASQCGTNCGKLLLAGSGGARNAELYTAPPVVKTVSTPVGSTAGGTTVTITGTGLTTASSVTFGGVAGTSVTHDSLTPDTKLTVVTPAHAAGLVDVVVTNLGAPSAVTSLSRFRFGGVVDFDNDARSDISVFRPSTGTWYAHPSAGGADTATGWGAAGDVAVTGDYDGDGRSDQAIFRPTTGLWAIHNSSGGDSFSTYGGIAGDVPVVADYDGDGRTDIAIYRPSVGTWYVHRSSDNVDMATTFGGIAGDLAVPGDFDGDAKADVAIFRSGTWFVHPSSGGPDTATGWGAPGDIPVPVDFDGDARSDLAVFRPGSGLWAIHPSAGGADSFVTYGGVGGDVPIAADYDGDARADIAIFRPSTGAWYVHRSTDNVDAITTFGVGGDVALPIPAAIRGAFF